MPVHVKREILKEKEDKVISVVGDFDNLELSDNLVDFAVSWDSMHHSTDPIKTLQECKRVLRKNGILIIVDRGHNNSTPDSEIQRMLNIRYDEEFLIKNHRPRNMILTREKMENMNIDFLNGENSSTKQVLTYWKV